MTHKGETEHKKSPARQTNQKRQKIITSARIAQQGCEITIFSYHFKVYHELRLPLITGKLHTLAFLKGPSAKKLRRESLLETTRSILVAPSPWPHALQ